MEMKRLEEFADVFSGQIITRMKNRDENNAETGKKVSIIVPKCIHSEGTINASEMAEEIVSAGFEKGKNKIAAEGDIVIKLGTPYDAGVVTAEVAGAVIPSFCAVIKDIKGIDRNYLLAALNSSFVKDQLKDQVAGTVTSILSVGRIKSVEIPVPDSKMQKEIGRRFMETQNKLAVIRKIEELEGKRNDILFSSIISRND